MKSSVSDTSRGTSEGASCCSPRALWGWSPPAAAADTPLKRGVDRLLTGFAGCAYLAAVVGLLLVAPLFPLRAELAVDGLAALAAGSWCGLNLWRSRRAHCLVTGPAWLALALFTFAEAALGRSLIHGDEQLVFLAVLAAGLAFEGAWYVVRRTNAVVAASA